MCPNIHILLGIWRGGGGGGWGGHHHPNRQHKFTTFRFEWLGSLLFRLQSFWNDQHSEAIDICVGTTLQGRSNLRTRGWMGCHAPILWPGDLSAISEDKCLPRCRSPRATCRGGSWQKWMWFFLGFHDALTSPRFSDYITFPWSRLYLTCSHDWDWMNCLRLCYDCNGRLALSYIIHTTFWPVSCQRTFWWLIPECSGWAL